MPNSTPPDPAPPAMGEVEIVRIRDGEPTRAKMFVVFQAPYGPASAAMFLGLDWDGAHWANYQRYDLAEVPTVGGRAFDLGRDPWIVDRVPVGGDRRRAYRVVIGSTPAEDLCDCRGAIGARERGTQCKHVAGLRWVIESGLQPLPVGDQ